MLAGNEILGTVGDTFNSVGETITDFLGDLFNFKSAKPIDDTIVSGASKSIGINTINFEQLPIQMPYPEKDFGREFYLKNPLIGDVQTKANAAYVKTLREKLADNIIDELEKTGHTNNILLRGLGGFYDGTPPTGGMKFFEIDDLESGRQTIIDDLFFSNFFSS